MLRDSEGDPSMMRFEEMQSPELKVTDSLTRITVELLQHVPTSELSLFGVISEGFNYTGPNVTYKLDEPQNFVATNEIAQQTRAKNKKVADLLGFIENYRAIEIQCVGVSDKRILIATPLQVEGKEKLSTGEQQIMFGPSDIMDMLRAKDEGFSLLPKRTLSQQIQASRILTERRRFLEVYEVARRANLEKYGATLGLQSTLPPSPGSAIRPASEKKENHIINKWRENTEKDLILKRRVRAKRVALTAEQLEEKSKKSKV